MIIGLTGGIASGKSTVSIILTKLGLPVVDADKIARQVVEQGEPAYKEIVKYFGTEILDSHGNLNRKQLGTLIFSDPKEREVLNNIVHPAVRKKMIEQKDTYLQQGYHHIVLDIPLLFESKLTHMVEKTLLIYVDEKKQLERLIMRDHAGKEDAERRISSQMPLKDKVLLADGVIDNNGSLSKTKEQLVNILRAWNIPINEKT
ncbi:dephospho-CoA kinase [Bacillus taeanensis]|uniref:Dephospho-CoA kinase n=1 Tax=Bacillus taeanensis TaxID=273032 RepID=A0A366Y3B6_9BACI|nr:dephospho-CoA kinase [Bacillus taeanensis]RBW71499.1 dephospho-CoA kinase [Bacillus taeanensis]